MGNEVANVVIAGLGGQGVLKASDVLAEAAFRAGLDVKKSELHGMSQRGGSVASDVRLGRAVLSPMVPSGEADYLVVLAADQVEVNRWRLRDAGTLIGPEAIDMGRLPNRRCLNVALLGVLANYLDIEERHWQDVLGAVFRQKYHEANREAFALGRASGKK